MEMQSKMGLLQETLESIRPLNYEMMVEAKDIWDSLTHPVGSLGQLEEMTIRLAGITGEPISSLEKRGIVVMAADNGVYAEDVSSSPQVFSLLLSEAMARGETGVAALAARQKAEVVVVDIGLISDGTYDKRIRNCCIRKGTKNIANEAAMTREEAIQAIEVGISIADELFEKGFDILGTGELGIANTTTSSAVLAAFTSAPIEDCVGLGGGITDAQLIKKRAVVRRAVARLKGETQDVIEVLAQVGGLDICGLVGVFLSAAKNRRPVVIDGLISSVAALAAKRLHPISVDYMFASHLSKEVAAAFVLQELCLKPLVTLDMRLGEGSGCPFTFDILDSALYAMTHMGTYDKTGITEGILVNIRDREV
ncbi:MAG: nicotinate-nucleotide--dimethylbenzimidazole phosphoribosyltransferase [Tissierellia bacterium]|nr:nicotinate-nucleotide--dimethylbenzimidazole phosphoribosyltransferase [Tissierellia bacterium]